jgi:hypothetical protein
LVRLYYGNHPVELPPLTRLARFACRIFVLSCRGACTGLWLSLNLNFLVGPKYFLNCSKSLNCNLDVFRPYPLIEECASPNGLFIGSMLLSFNVKLFIYFTLLAVGGK